MKNVALKALLSVRFREILASFAARNRAKKRNGTGSAVLFAILYLYLGFVVVGGMCFLFSVLASAYHALELDWLYFSVAGLIALAIAVFGSVFSTQSQLYDSKDNDLLLSMPIKPSVILLSRIFSLLCLTLVFTALVMVPAIVIYALQVRFSILGLLLQVMSLLCITLLSQVISCLLGWLLHLLLSRVNKSVATLVSTLLFLGGYFYFYFQASSILGSMTAQGQQLGSALRTWVWPLYAMGRGCMGEAGYFLAVSAICIGLFAAVCSLLSATFLRVSGSSRSSKRRALKMHSLRSSSPRKAMLVKELRHFLECPAYLSNVGVGILLTAAMGIAGVVFRGTVLSFLQATGVSELLPHVSLFITALLGFAVSTCCASAPSVSLEGKTIWILKVTPVKSREILEAKLEFHCLLSVPIAILAGIVLGWAYGCSLWNCLLCGIVPGLTALFCGLLGMLYGLKWCRLNWLNEAYPCKQSMAVGITTLTCMCLPLVVLFLYFMLLSERLSASAFLSIYAGLLAVLCAIFYRTMITWGVAKWEEL